MPGWTVPGPGNAPIITEQSGLAEPYSGRSDDSAPDGKSPPWVRSRLAACEGPQERYPRGAAKRPEAGTTAHLGHCGTIENAQATAPHESPRTTKLYDRTKDELALDAVERIVI